MSANPIRLVGNTAPYFKVQALTPEGEFKEISLDDYEGKWKVLFFYPLDFTFVCPTEILAYSEAVAQFKELNCEVIGCSVDSHYSHLVWTKTPLNEGGIGPIKYPLLSDLGRTMAQDYGVFLEDAGVALRGLFIIDDKNIIQHSTVNNLSVGRNPEETLRLVEAYQYTAKSGDVCPVNWTKGSLTIRPDPEGAKDYFNRPKK